MDFLEYTPTKGSGNSNLAAENESLKEQKFLLEKLLYAKNNHIAVLEKMITTLHEQVSEADAQFEQLLDVRDKLDKIKNIFPDQTIYPKRDEDDDSIEGSLSGLENKIADMQSSLTQIQEQLKNLQERNLLLQQQNIRIGELESMLAIKTNRDE